MMRLSPHESLGLSLASVAAVSGTVAIMLGWVSPGPIRGPDVTRATHVSVMVPPVAVRVGNLTGQD